MEKGQHRATLMEEQRPLKVLTLGTRNSTTFIAHIVKLVLMFLRGWWSSSVSDFDHPQGSLQSHCKTKGVARPPAPHELFDVIGGVGTGG